MCENCIRILEEEKHRSAPCLRYLVKKMKGTGILIYKSKHEKSTTVHTSENVAAVAESVREALSTSIQRGPQQLDISETSLKGILHKDLDMKPWF